MKYKLLSDADMKAIDSLKEFHGGASNINKTISEMRNFETRKKILGKKGFGKMIEDSLEYVKSFPKVGDFEKENNITYNNNFGIATSQVSGFQGAKVTLRCIQRIAESASSDNPCFAPNEMISVVALTDNYIYNGDLLATLTMSENILKASKFCSTNLIGIPQPLSRFKELEKVTGKTFEIAELGDDLAQIILKNQGTAFGNLGGVEVANDNHLVYLDGVTRAALTTGGNFYLNPSWSTIIAACYFGRDIPNLDFKISMLLSTQNLMQFRMLLNIMNEYIRDDKTSPLYEINIGNGASPETFIQCAKDLKESGIKGLSLAAHIRINPDLGLEDFNWTDNSFKVLESGTDITFKYESDGNKRDFDTMGDYFLPEEDRDKYSTEIGNVIYYKSIRATMDGMEMMKKGIKVSFAESSY